MEHPVARKIQTVFIDELDGSEAEDTVRFGLDGTDYEIDLNAERARALRDALTVCGCGAAARAWAQGGGRAGQHLGRPVGQRARHRGEARAGAR
jgi:hypothetical protein